uniref:helix-turn-helix domain-containing protein n=1 Tax=Citrobacter koseri TaxID=545 RepID=UPI0013D8A61A
AAHRMLRQGKHRGKTITDIALDVGFANISYFNRAFRRTFNATPSDVRAGASPDTRDDWSPTAIPS